MRLYWWSCPWCGDRMEMRHTEAEVLIDRDAHIEANHQEAVGKPYMFAVSSYHFRDPH